MYLETLEDSVRDRPFSGTKVRKKEEQGRGPKKVDGDRDTNLKY